jgi:putative tryptophan/tyrosine transport system substrate-binding protein
MLNRIRWRLAAEIIDPTSRMAMNVRPKADIEVKGFYFRFWPKADISRPTIIEAEFTRFTPELKYTFPLGRRLVLGREKDMRRREFMTLLGSVVATWPIAAPAQQLDRMRRIGVVMGYAEADSEARSWVKAFVQELEVQGWTDGRNLQIHLRWAGGDVAEMRALAKELVKLKPDLILSNSTPVTGALVHETKTIPIVFVVVSDPVGAGFVASLSHPGGNVTGFINIEASMAGKWLDLLKEIAPGVKRVALMFNPDTAPGRGFYFLNPFQVAALSFGVEPIAAAVQTDGDIEKVISSLGDVPGGGLVSMTDSFTFVHRATIIGEAARHKVPAMYSSRIHTVDGGLLSYGPTYIDLFRRAATYVDRILRGARSAELPVQVPIKYELTLNLKTAKALGLTVPLHLQQMADEVIE